MIRRYWLDGLALLLFTLSSCAFVHFFHLHKSNEASYGQLNRLEILAPKLLNELLDINFASKQHYDSYSQLQLELDQIKRKLPMYSESRTLVDLYSELSSRYMELASMLKTSRRLVAYSQLEQLSDSQRLTILELNNALNQHNLAQNDYEHERVHNMIENASVVFTEHSDNVFSWEHYKQHYEFVLDKFDAAAEQKELLQEIDIAAIINKQRTVYMEQQVWYQTVQLTSAFGILLSFVLVFIAVLQRQRKLLIEKNVQYREAAEVKSRFLANMSHEIRTPMTGIIGLAELCFTTKLDEQQKDYLSKLHFSASSLLVIINDILDFSKIESGKLAIENIDFDNTKLFDNLSVMLGKAAQQKSIELIYDLDTKIPSTLKGDPVRVSQILLNLVNNAIKFTDKGHVTVKSKLLSADEHIHVEYKVIDTGIGLTEEQRSRLFGRFEQADDSTTRKYGGTGLGLSIVKLLVELLGGTISVDSEKGKGSCFTVRLPFSEPSAKKHESMNLEQLTGKQLLVIEDNPISQTVLKKIAEELKLSVVLVDSVEQALKCTQQQQFDFALIDWHLPEESGLEFIKKVQATSQKPHRLIVCSAFELDFIKKHVDEALEFEYISKPLTSWTLYYVLTEHNIAKYDHMVSDAEGLAPLTKSETAKEVPRILLVEDNKVNQTIASAMIKSFGLDMDLAENGKQALEMIENSEYKLVLMDIQMPVMDGVTATTEIRKSHDKDSLPIIALTANVTAEEVESYLSIGMNSHLGKPYDKSAMANALQVYLESV